MSALVEPDPDTVIAACLADLEANAPPAPVLAKLRTAQGHVGERSPHRPRLLRAQAICKQRLGYSEDALGDLHEARRLLEAEKHQHEELAHVFRAIAVIHSWRGEARDAALALLRTVAEGTAADDPTAVRLALIEAGRLQIEIGHPHDAVALLAGALDGEGPNLAEHEHHRAAVNLVQALVAAGRHNEARARLDLLMPMLGDGRPRLLAQIEQARLAQGAGDSAHADAILAQAGKLATDPQSFSHVDLAHVRAELMLAQGDADAAERLLRDVVTRYATDQLVGREVVARLLQAKAFDALGRSEEAERTLVAALRRALARGLTGHVDEARSRIAARGGVERAWSPGDAPAGSACADAAQRFVRRRPLGAGGFGSVSRAYDLELGFEVALKRTSLKDVYDPVARTRLLSAARTEIAAMSRIEHPGVAHIHGLLIDADGDALLVQEFIEGPTLALEAVQTGKPMKQMRALDLLARIAFAVAAIHGAGVVHRDLKPANVILRNGVSPVIVDFGVALVGQAHDAARGAGTPSYMAPEQVRGHRTDFRTDLYSIGVMAHELLIASRPEPPVTGGFALMTHHGRARRIRSRLVAAGVEMAVADLVACLLATRRQQRPNSAAFVGTRFAEAASRAAVDARE